jgi:hypothetical protein
MRLFSLIPTLAILVAAVAGAALPRDVKTDNCGAEAGCEYSGLNLKRDIFEHPSRTVNELTNAELLRRGLPLNNPVMRRGAYVAVCVASPNLTNVYLPGTPVRRHRPSAAPEHGKKHHRGLIMIRSQSDNSILGYVSRDPTSSAQYRADSNRDNALVVNFKTGSSGSGTQINITPEVSPDPLRRRVLVSHSPPPPRRTRRSHIPASLVQSRVVTTQTLSCPQYPSSGSSNQVSPHTWINRTFDRYLYLGNTHESMSAPFNLKDG